MSFKTDLPWRISVRYMRKQNLQMEGRYDISLKIKQIYRYL